MRILRINEAAEKVGHKRAAYYEDVRAGVLPPAVALGGRKVGWVDVELQVMNSGRTAGLGEDALRELVRVLVELRVAAPSDEEVLAAGREFITARAKHGAHAAVQQGVNAVAA
jgi:predicted DNA-binding transcriptional regulator AlpA